MAIVVTPSSQSPLTRSFGTLKTEAARYCLLPNDNEALAVAGDGINEAVRELNAMVWYWMRTYHDITLVAGTGDYTVPATYKDSFSMELLNSSGDSVCRLGFLDPKTLLRYFPDTTADGAPEAYTVFNPYNNAVVSFNRAPTTGVVSTFPTARHWFYARLQKLEGDDARLNLPSEVEAFIQWKGKAYVAAVYDSSKYALAENKAELAFRRLRADNTQTGFRDWSE